MLKREWDRHEVCRTRDEARGANAFDDIEMFDNPTRKHALNGVQSPVSLEPQHKAQAEGVWMAQGGSDGDPAYSGWR